MILPSKLEIIATKRFLAPSPLITPGKTVKFEWDKKAGFITGKDADYINTDKNRCNARVS